MVWAYQSAQHEFSSGSFVAALVVWWASHHAVLMIAAETR